MRMSRIAGAALRRRWNMPRGRKNELSLMNRKMPASYYYVVCRLLLFILSVILRGFLLCQRDMRTMFLYNKPKNEILICENEKTSHEALIKRIIEGIIIDRRCNEYAVVFQSKELPVFPG